MDFKTYLTYFKNIIDAEKPEAPYDDSEYFQYTKLNWSRTNRWLKKGQLEEATVQAIQAIDQAQEWILITEPWCGDAGQVSPFIYLMAELNPLITLRVELRDQPPHLIDQYLTNGTKSIPKLVIRDAQGRDLGVWGPRPQGAQDLFQKMKAEEADFEKIKEDLQKWYNDDAGAGIQREIIALLA